MTGSVAFIERVARALYVAEYPEGNSDAHLDCIFWIGPDAQGEDADYRLHCDQMRRAARVALEALRDPTPEMAEEGADAWTSGVVGDVLRKSWQAMIDEALRSKDKG